MNGGQATGESDRGELLDLERALAGDREAIARLLCLHGGRLAARLSHRLQLNPFVEFSADDVLQEVFLDVFRGFHTFSQSRGVPFVSWLDKVADNRLATMMRDRGRQKRGGGFRRAEPAQDLLYSSAAQLVAALADSRQATASQNIARDELVRAVQVGLATLPDDQREVIQKRYFDQQSLASTAHSMGRTVAAVRGLLHRAKRSLQDVLSGTVS